MEKGIIKEGDKTKRFLASDIPNSRIFLNMAILDVDESKLKILKLKKYKKTR